LAIEQKKRTFRAQAVHLGGSLGESKAGFYGKPDRIGIGFDVKGAEHRSAMHLDRPLGEAELKTHLLVELASRHQK
jgi:hypothetical protein